MVVHSWTQILRCHSARSGGYPVSSRDPPRPWRSYPPACRSRAPPGGTRDRDPRGRSPGRRRRPAPAALPVRAPPARRAGLAPLPGMGRRHGRRLALCAVAACALREERRAAQGCPRRPRRRALLRGPRGRHRAGRHHVDAAAAADAQHDGALRRPRGPRFADRRVLRRPDPPLHAAGAERPAYGLDVAPARDARLAARARDVGGRGPHPPLPHQGARRAAHDVPAVLRPLHAHGPRRQLHRRRSRS